jgi:hypothetical protein
VRSESPAERGDNELRALARVPAATRVWTVGEAGQSALGDPAQTLTETQP